MSTHSFIRRINHFTSFKLVGSAFYIRGDYSCLNHNGIRKSKINGYGRSAISANIMSEIGITKNTKSHIRVNKKLVIFDSYSDFGHI